SPTERGAFLRFRFPPSAPAYVVFDGYTESCDLEIDEDGQQIVGSVRNGRNLPNGFRNFFVLSFDQPAVSSGTWRKPRNGGPVITQSAAISGQKVGAYLQFQPGATVNIRVASSYISPDQAALNLQSKLGDARDVESVSESAKQAWNRTLGKIRVEGGTEEQRKTFYSCMFRASLFPRKFYEIDAAGNPLYRSPYDGKVHAGYMFTDTGLWDTFRGQMPLNTILQPEMHGRYLQAMLAAHEQCGWLPSWSFPGEAGSMIGNHAISVFADAWFKGIRTFDPANALAAYAHETSAKGPWGPSNGRGGWEDIERLGYLPYPKHGEATSKTLEYAYDDFCGNRLARDTGQDEFAMALANRMFNYRNVFDAAIGFMRGRDEHGRWAPDFDPIEWGGPFTEGCAWHWNWSVFHDIAGLIALMGGDDEFVARLDAVFEQSSDYKVGTYGAPIHEMREMALANMGQYAHGNQPIQHMPYLYCYAGQPWKTQQRVRTVLDRLYNSSENGYPGDEDQGQTSAWYVLSAIGFYSVCPGTDEYVLGSPLFDKITILHDTGAEFVVEANNNSPENVYVQEVRLNNSEYTHDFLRHGDIVRGGRVEMDMGPQPNLQRGTNPEDRPFSVSKEQPLSSTRTLENSHGQPAEAVGAEKSH
ncbi:MAG TPA: GH92 family glycosyl hydrolase, partial [Lacipirellulaceae bacterium]|nr:GH92 family glycosyl hydrolase [Lacipirellulaceae bacterium]